MVAVMMLSLLANAATWYQQIKIKRAIDSDLAHLLEVIKERLGSGEQSSSLYVTTLAELERMLGRMEATAHGQPSCRSLIDQAAEAAQQIVEKGPTLRRDLDFYINQAQPYCVAH